MLPRAHTHSYRPTLIKCNFRFFAIDELFSSCRQQHHKFRNANSQMDKWRVAEPGPERERKRTKQTLSHLTFRRVKIRKKNIRKYANMEKVLGVRERRKIDVFFANSVGELPCDGIVFNFSIQPIKVCQKTNEQKIILKTNILVSSQAHDAGKWWQRNRQRKITKWWKSHGKLQEKKNRKKHDEKNDDVDRKKTKKKWTHFSHGKVSTFAYLFFVCRVFFSLWMCVCVKIQNTWWFAHTRHLRHTQ